ncbi:MAG: sigma-70 family RNA polymerase sigma factor [Armatimonadota bacterium]
MRTQNTKKLSEEQINELVAKYKSTNDPAIRDTIVMQYNNLVESVARRFLGAGEPLEDLVQEGYVGLIRSVDKYDPEIGVKFSTYATHFIIGEVKHYLRDRGKIIKEPAWLQELNQRMTRVIESLSQNLGRTPTEKEIAQMMQMRESTVREMLMTREVFKVLSLEEEREDASGPKESEKIADTKLTTFQLPLEDKIVLETALHRLKDIEQRVLHMHFYKGLNQTEIADKLGISCNYVSHILRNSTRKLKKILITDELRDIQIQRAFRSRHLEPIADVPESVLDTTARVYNQHYFCQRLNEELSRAYRERYPVAVLLVEVCLPENMDHYIRLVRTDDVLYHVAQALKGNVRKMDLVARLSGNYFAIMLPHTLTQAGIVAQRIAKVVASIQVCTGHAASNLACQARTAHALYPEDAENSTQLLACAADRLAVELKDLLGEEENWFGLAA